MTSKYYKRSAAGAVVDPDVLTWTELITQWAKDNEPKMIHDDGKLIQNRFAILTGITTTVINRWFNRGSLPQHGALEQVHEATGIPMSSLVASHDKSKALWLHRNSSGDILNNADNILALTERVEKIEADMKEMADRLKEHDAAIEELRRNHR